MRTTVDLPPALHERVKELASLRHQSLSATIAELTTRGLVGVGDSIRVSVDPVSGLPAISIGKTISSAEVAELIDED